MPARMVSMGLAARPVFFLRTKLLPPRPAPALLPRPRLIEQLEANLARPVTLVTADAGSGKTTLVADFLRQRSGPSVWYQLDPSDADPFVFLGYLTHGLMQAVPGFGEVMLSYLEQSAAEVARHPQQAVDVLLNEVLDKVEQRLIVVLDDYHHLGIETAVHGVVDRLAAYLPEMVHLVIISRETPPLAVARLRSQASLAIIDRNQLLFTDQETQDLFRQVFDLELTPEQLSEYRTRTHGWITALQLVRQVAHRKALSSGSAAGDAAALDLVEILRQSERDIFDYFAEEVFADEPEEIQRLLLRISLLDRVDIDDCERLFLTHNSGSILAALARRNVFMTLASDERGEEYRLHPLFRSFLRRRLRAELGAAGVASEHLRCAEHFLERGEWEQAMRHLLAGESFDRAAALIAEKGWALIANGALASLVSFADALPASALGAHPRALACLAEAMRLRGEYDPAQGLFRRAATLLRERGDREGEAEALHSLATIARRRGDFETAFTYLDRAVGLTDERSLIRIKCGNTRGLCLVATGEWSRAELEFRLALQAAEERNDEHYIRLIAHNLGTPAGIRGDFGEALRWLRRMLGHHQQSTLPREAVAYLNMARCYLYRGEMVECERHLDHALERCHLFNLVALFGEVFEAYGNLYRERGEAERAADFYGRAERAYEQAGIQLAEVELLEERALLALSLGDLASARTQLKRLIDSRPAAKDPLKFYTATLSLGRVMLAQREYETARAELLPARDYFHAHGLNYHEAQASMALAVAGQATGAEAEMMARLSRALDLAARYDYEHWLHREVARNPQLFSSPEALELLPADARESLRMPSQPPVVAPGAGISGRVPMTDLTINLLGHVEFVRDPARPFAADAWATKRARDILCFIASRPHRRASKDAIIDAFWEDADLEAVEKNFHPTISHIRKALNSNQPLKQNFLVYREGDYQLSPDFSYRLDVEEFDRLAGEAETARRNREVESCIAFSEQALALYRGEFMQGNYDDWVAEPRSYYREQRLRILESLSALAEKGRDWDRALRFSQQILHDDPFREDIHCRVMRSLAGLGNRGAVKEQYESLQHLLREELGVEPVPETRRTYEELLR